MTSSKLEGDAVNFDVEPDSIVGCVFVNALVPTDSVGAATETRRSPCRRPTRSVCRRRQPMRSWRIMLVLMAGLLASVLILTPKRASRRR